MTFFKSDKKRRDIVLKLKNKFLAFFIVLCAILQLSTIHAQSDQNVDATGAIVNSSEDYYFNGSEFSEEYNFTNESMSNVGITIPPDYFYVEAGTDILSSIKIMNLGSKRREDVVLNFEIMNANKEVLLTKTETVAVETQANVVRTFQLPKDAKIGRYTIRVTLTHANGKEAVAEAYFEIRDKKAELYNTIYITAGTVLAMGLILLLILKSGRWIEHFELRRKVHRIVRNKLESSKIQQA
jgi:hypothetical protein